MRPTRTSASSRTVRLFIAINLPADVRRLAHAAAAPLREAAPHAHWVAEENLHLTLKFLGEVPEDAGPAIAAAVGAASACHRRTELELRDFGAFPNLRRPRVVWAGVLPDPRLELLQHDLEVACEGLGFEVEGRPFRPHVTLGRVKVAAAPEEVRALARAARSARLHAACTVESVDVMRSDPSRDGARYSVLAALPLMPQSPLRSA